MEADSVSNRVKAESDGRSIELRVRVKAES
jgi:hypothetical protein